MASTSHRGRIDRALDALQQIADPLSRVDAARSSREQFEAVEAAAVREARAAGVTWKEIGALYGLSKQGAQQRFRPVAASSEPAEAQPAQHVSVASPQDA